MIKVHGVMAEGLIHSGTERKPQLNRESHQEPSDIVTISEEGKKKRIMGHVMASLTGPGTGKL